MFNIQEVSIGEIWYVNDYALFGGKKNVCHPALIIDIDYFNEKITVHMCSTKKPQNNIYESIKVKNKNSFVVNKDIIVDIEDLRGIVQDIDY